MLNYLKKQITSLSRVILVFTPWVLSMYLLYSLGKYEIWVPETAHRDKITAAIILLGLVMSFLLQSYFDKNKKK
jgi:ABC-type molybdate transport system permease subunit